MNDKITIYIVVTDAGGNINECDLFFNKDVAFNDAIEKAKKYTYTQFVNYNPLKQTDFKGQAYWILLDTLTKSVVVFERLVDVKDLSKSIEIEQKNITGLQGPTKDDIKNIICATGPQGPTKDYEPINSSFGATFSSFRMIPKKGYVVMKPNDNGVVEPVVIRPSNFTGSCTQMPIDDPFAPELPAGWNKDDKPILIKDVLLDPQNYKDLANCSEDQLFALIIARLNKRNNYQSYVSISGKKYCKSEVLTELNNQTILGWEVRDFEIEKLENFINENANK